MLLHAECSVKVFLSCVPAAADVFELVCSECTSCRAYMRQYTHDKTYEMKLWSAAGSAVTHPAAVRRSSSGSVFCSMWRCSVRRGWRASALCRGFPVERCIMLRHLSKAAEEAPPGSQSPPAKRACPDPQVNTTETPLEHSVAVPSRCPIVLFLSFVFLLRTCSGSLLQIRCSLGVCDSFCSHWWQIPWKDLNRLFLFVLLVVGHDCYLFYTWNRDGTD